LLDKGADIEFKNRFGQTSLYWAVMGGGEAIIKLLFYKGADVESKDIYGQTPLYWAVKKGHEAVIELLLDKGAGTKFKGSPYNQHHSHRLLLDKGANIESNDIYGCSERSRGSSNAAAQQRC
jgi:ankyrin repeat protein